MARSPQGPKERLESETDFQRAFPCQDERKRKPAQAGARLETLPGPRRAGWAAALTASSLSSSWFSCPLPKSPDA